METPSIPLDTPARRLLWVGLVLTGWALFLMGRLFCLQVIGHDRFVRLAQGQQERLEPLAGPRGVILDRRGHVLAISSKSELVALNPLRIPDPDMAAALLAPILGVDTARLAAEICSAKAEHRGFLIAARQLTPKQAESVRALGLEWLEVREGSVRTYPNGSLATHVVGNVNAAERGAAGLELKFDRELSGKPGLLRVTADVKRNGYEADLVTEPTLGKNITLTIDSELQYAAEVALKHAVIENHAQHGSVVALEPSTGEVLALANYPTYDPNERVRAGERLSGRENLAVVAPFEPGSVFKVITLSAALETTRLRPDTLINCGNGVLRIADRVIHDAHPYAILSMADVLAKSSNIGAIRVGMSVGDQNLYDYIRRFGFGRRTGIELPAEAPGLIRPLSRWRTTSIGSVAMGHEVSVTSVQLAQAGAVIANGGLLVKPHVIKFRQAPDGQAEIPFHAGAVRVLQPETVSTMREMMERVVLKGGTAPKAHLYGYTTAGKTGTAQIFDFAHHVYTHRYNASFLGFAPAVNPRIVVVATVSGTTGEAGFGGAASGPVFKTVASLALRMMGVPPDAAEMFEPDRKQQAAPGDLSIAALSEPFTQEDEAQAEGAGPAPDAPPEPAVSIVAGGPKAPSFLGKSVRDVITEATAAGITVELTGQGLARAQDPPPGALLPPGKHIQVKFAR